VARLGEVEAPLRERVLESHLRVNQSIKSLIETPKYIGI
ncbi:MAG: hypothetical protein ACI9HK_001684, partial [Pirellulaceae bacterium]